MKYIILLLSLFLISCENNNNVTISKEEYKQLKGDTIKPEYPKYVDFDLINYQIKSDKKIEVVKIDGCEYLICTYASDYRSFGITHKGNCKYCKKDTL